MSAPASPSAPPPSPSPSPENEKEGKLEGEGFRTTRKILASLASLGVLETLWLLGAKVFASPAAICRTSGCIDVLSGPYSSFVGVPLSAFGMLAYAAFAWLSAWPLGATEEYVVVSDDGDTTLRSAEESYAVKDAATRPLMLAVSSVLFVFSSYFMWLLTSVLRDTCPYCIFSAVLSTSIFAITAFFGRAVRNTAQAVKVGGSSALAAAFAAAAIFVLSSPGGLLAQMPSEPQKPPVITEQSDSRMVNISRKLKKRNTKMYGAYWCNHCFHQKQQLGKKAFGNIEYIECDKGGFNTQMKLCREKKIPGYPTWEIDGELFPGEIAIDDLEKLANGEPLE